MVRILLCVVCFMLIYSFMHYIVQVSHLEMREEEQNNLKVIIQQVCH